MDEIDEETLAYAKSYTGGFERCDIVRKVFEEYGETEWSLADFLSDIQEAVAGIPEDKRAVATVRLECDYDESTKFSISYPDTESDDELNERVQSAIKAAIRKRA